jgi:hypothetical protein
MDPKVFECMKKRGWLDKNNKPKWPFAFATWSEDITDDEGTIPAECIKLAIHYHFHPFHEPHDPFFRNQGLSAATLEHYGRRMVRSIPDAYTYKDNPWNPWKRFPNLNCLECHGEGGKLSQIYDTKAFNFKMCKCIIGLPEGRDGCPKCRNTGNRDLRILGKVPGSFITKVVDCDCLR